MQTGPATQARYTRVAIALHWTIALLVIVEFAWGWVMQGIAKNPPGLRAEAFNLHKSIGLTILALMLVRLAWRLAHRPPPFVPMPRWQAVTAHFTHGVLYAALLAQPVIGYLGSAFSGRPVKFFGAALPRWAAAHDGAKELMSTLHLATSWIIAAAVLLHIAGAMKHALVDNDGLLARMGLGQPPPRAAGADSRTRTVSP